MILEARYTLTSGIFSDIWVNHAKRLRKSSWFLNTWLELLYTERELVPFKISVFPSYHCQNFGNMDEHKCNMSHTSTLKKFFKMLEFLSDRVPV